jgi:hypothetical protein
MAEPREFSIAAEETSVAFAEYLLRTAVASAGALHRYEQLIGCVARRQASPATLEESLARFAELHAGESAARVSAATARLIAGLASSTFLPLAAADDSEPPTSTDTSGTSGTSGTSDALARLADRVGDRNRRAVDAYYAQLAAVATGETTPDAFRRLTRKDTSHTFAQELSRASRIWFDYLGDLDEERARFADQYLMSVLRTVNPVGFDGDVVELAGPVNTMVSTVVTVDNSRDEPAVIRCEASEVRRADGVGPAFEPALVVAPEDVVLERDAEGSVELSLWLDDAIYDPGVAYIGALRLVRDGAPRLDVALRITPRSAPNATVALP